MLITEMMYRFLAPELSAQFITADMGRPSVIRSLLPIPGGLLLPPMVGGLVGRWPRATARRPTTSATQRMLSYTASCADCRVYA